MKNIDKLIIDVGNSGAKCLLDATVQRFYYSSDWENEFEKYVVALPKGIQKIYFSTVNFRQWNFLKDILQKHSYTNFINSAELLPKQELMNYDKDKGWGNDRLLGMYAALCKTPAPLITVDCGTAVTINVIDKDNYCVGGPIFASVYTQLNALASTTEALKNVEMFLPDNLIATNTEDALRTGILFSIVGAVLYFSKKLKEEFNCPKLPIHLTGGASEHIKKILENEEDYLFYNQNLVTDGIKYLSEKY